ncbi:hypothetical protein [Bernardetia sp. MNP-M8]|uniref:hypothetical protein n=1 Tax=Bernardetia sp. MNP-M8 TaxID=3127470 RepID=UPI0030CE4CFA
MNKQEKNKLKELFSDDTKAFFKYMQEILENEDTFFNTLLSQKNKWKRSRKEFKKEELTKEEYNKYFSKIEDNIFDLIDEFAEYSVAMKEEEIHNEEDGITTEELFEIIATINFENQEKIFKSFIRYRKFATFFIRGKENCGQEWLIHQLAEQNFPKGIKINIGSLSQITLEIIIEELQKYAKATFKEGIKYENSTKLQMIAEKLSNQKKEDHYIVIDCSHGFVTTEEFCVFYENFISHITPRAASELEAKVILFLKDSTDTSYQISEQINYWCCETGKDDTKFDADWQKNITKPYIIDLHRIEAFDTNLLWNWRRNKITEISIKQKLKNKETIERLLKEEYENGNPKKIIDDICSLINYTY